MKFNGHTHFFIRNSFIRNLYWDGQIAKKLSVLKLQRLRNLQSFFFFFYHNFEATVTNFHKDMLRKESFCGTNPYMKTILKSVVICFSL